MDTAEFLFPSTLEVTPLPIKNVLFIGSCLAEFYVLRLRQRRPDVTYDYILFNNAVDLPTQSPEALQRYDLQYIQLPLRTVLTDAAMRPVDFECRSSVDEFIDIGKRNIDQMLDKALHYNRQAGLLTLVSTFIVPQAPMAPSLADQRTPKDLRFVVTSLNDYLAEAIASHANVFIADVDMIADSIGKRYFFDDWVVFSTHNSVFFDDWHHFEGLRIEKVPPITDLYENRLGEFFEATFRQMEAMYRAAQSLDMVKVVIFDLDNTMWRGQLAEDYQPGASRPTTDGWPLGVWDAVNQLRWRGVVTAIASKNDFSAIAEKWEDVVQPPFVQLDDFLIKKIEWRPKAETIGEILTQLSVTAKSAVFVDDNPIERASVKAALPDIRVIGSNPFEVKRTLLWSAETQMRSRSQETKQREVMLRQQFDREAHRLAVSHDEFVQTLESRVTLWEVRSAEHASFGRVFELVNKTNQFNTNGVRWTLQQYDAFFAAGGRLFAFSVADRFASYGTVGALFVRDFDIQQFIMSCRVLGMSVENAVLDAVCTSLRRTDAEAIRGHIVETQSNTPCRSLYLNAGFMATGQDGEFVLPCAEAPRRASHAAVTLET